MVCSLSSFGCVLVLIRYWPTTVYWSNRSAFSYRTLQPRQAKFSPDCSLLAIAHDQGQLTLWDVGTNAMLQALSCTDVKDSRECAFLGKSGRYVVLSGPHGLAVWDLVSGKGLYPLNLNGVWTEGVQSSSHIVPPSGIYNDLFHIRPLNSSLCCNRQSSPPVSSPSFLLTPQRLLDNARYLSFSDNASSTIRVVRL
jgi:hypothetical protein